MKNIITLNLCLSYSLVTLLLMGTANAKLSKKKNTQRGEKQSRQEEYGVGTTTETLSIEDIRKASSVNITDLDAKNPNSISILTDNKDAFDNKIKAIRDANEGDSIDLIYFLFSDDHSSSFYARELIKAAEKGVKVRILLDYFNNFKRLDMFSMLERKGKGNISVRFYNRPTKNFVRDAMYLTTGCGTGLVISEMDENCAETKKTVIAKILADESGCDLFVTTQEPTHRYHLPALTKSGDVLSSWEFVNGEIERISLVGGTTLSSLNFKESRDRTTHLSVNQCNLIGSSDGHIFDTSTLVQGDPIYNIGTDDSNINISNASNGLSAQLLAGYYSKNPKYMAAVMQVARKDLLDKLKPDQNAAPTSDEDKKALAKLVKIYFLSQVASSVFVRYSNKLKLLGAKLFYNDKVAPILEIINDAFPFNVPTINDKRLSDYDYLSDFTHHKFLLAKNTFILGGRNVENSYHVRRISDKAKNLTDKYLFMDTDVRIELGAHSVTKIKKTFDKLWDFTRMVATLTDVRKHTDNNQIRNLYISGKECNEEHRPKPNETEEEKKTAIADCISNKKFRSLDNRIELVAQELEIRANKYEAYAVVAAKEKSNKPWDTVGPFKLDLKQAGVLVSYIENLPFDKSKGIRGLRRSYGAHPWTVADGNKSIHYLLNQSIRNACSMSTKKSPKKIFLHNAYFLPTGEILNTFGDMINGTLPCKHVTVTIFSNSFDTTDLNVVNFLSRYTLKALFEHYRMHKKDNYAATFKYIVYQKGEGVNYSLHSKVSVIGDDVIIGSANMDLRSYMMDTNNGVFIRGATKFVKDYTAFLNSMINNPKFAKDKTQDYIKLSNKRDDDIRKISEIWMDKQLAQFNLGKDRDKIIKKVKSGLLNIALTAYDGAKAAINSSALWRSYKREKKLKTEAIRNYNRMFKGI